MRPLTYDGIFGEWLRNAMIDHEVTERELAAYLDMHYVTISYHLNGKRIPRFNTLKKYADYFGVDVWELYEMAVS